MSARRIRPAAGAISARFRAVPSKSVTHRALVAAALAEGTSLVRGPLDSEDTRATLRGLRDLGFQVDAGPGAWAVRGAGGRVPGGGSLDLGASGTSLRFLLALAARGERPSTLGGAPRLAERPVEELAGALRRLGMPVESIPPSPGGPFLRAGGGSPRGGRVEVPGERSSQFASALLLLGATLPGGLEIRIPGRQVSAPYVALTAAVLEAFGGRAERVADGWRVRPGPLSPRDFLVEGDHSAASYLLAAAAVCRGTVRVEGLDPLSLQPDAALAGLLERLGCRVAREERAVTVEGRGELPGFAFDLTECPDLGPTVAILALFASGPSRLEGAGHLRHKESDRLAVLEENLRALGRGARAEGTALAVDGPAPLRGARIRTAGDHRIGMAFAIAGLRLPGVAIDDPACVRKSHPGFWRDLERLEGGAEPPDRQNW